MRPVTIPASILAALAALFFLSEFAFGQTTQPATAPSAERTRVMLIPFHAIGDGDRYGWMAKAIDEDLANDLQANAALHLVRASGVPTTQTSDGLAVARDANANLLVTGSYQVADSQVRITGQIINVQTTDPVGQIKATGEARQLFALEDSLAMQLWRAMPRPAEPSAVASVDFSEPLHGGYGVSPVPSYPVQSYSVQSYTDSVMPAQPQAQSSDVPNYDYGYAQAPYDYDNPLYADDFYPFYPGIFYGFYGHNRFHDFHHGDGGHRLLYGQQTNVGTGHISGAQAGVISHPFPAREGIGANGFHGGGGMGHGYAGQH